MISLELVAHFAGHDGELGRASIEAVPTSGLGHDSRRCTAGIEEVVHGVSLQEYHCIASGVF